jgi:hypothetical protein
MPNREQYHWFNCFEISESSFKMSEYRTVLFLVRADMLNLSFCREFYKG